MHKIYVVYGKNTRFIQYTLELALQRVGYLTDECDGIWEESNFAVIRAVYLSDFEYKAWEAYRKRLINNEVADLDLVKLGSDIDRQKFGDTRDITHDFLVNGGK